MTTEEFNSIITFVFWNTRPYYRIVITVLKLWNPSQPYAVSVSIAIQNVVLKKPTYLSKVKNMSRFTGNIQFFKDGLSAL
jgi:hypothetical protein